MERSAPYTRYQAIMDEATWSGQEARAARVEETSEMKCATKASAEYPIYPDYTEPERQTAALPAQGGR